MYYRDWEETLTCVQLGNCWPGVEMWVFVHQACGVEMMSKQRSGNWGRSRNGDLMYNEASTLLIDHYLDNHVTIHVD